MNETGIKRIGAGVSTVLVLGVSVVAFCAGAQRGKNTPAALASRAPVQNTPALCGQAYVGRPSGKRPSVSPGRPSARAGMAGEFQRQSALVLGYGELVEQHPAVFVDIVTGAIDRVPLICLISNDRQRRLAEYLLRANGIPVSSVSFMATPAQTMWVRDYGPLFVQRADGTVEIVDTDYAEDRNDNEAAAEDGAPAWIGWQLNVPVVSARLRMDGGNFLTNGDGLCITTSAVLDRNFDVGYGKEQIRALLKSLLDCEKWICVQPLEGEDTQHVDMFVAFLAENIAVVAHCDPLADPLNAAILDDAAAALARQTTSMGPMQVHRVPMPDARGGVWKSYTNVIFANGVLLVPSYSDVDPAVEEEAFSLYARLLPGWKVVGIRADSLARLGGALHCISVNVPDFVRIDPARLVWPAARGSESPTETSRGSVFNRPVAPAETRVFESWPARYTRYNRAGGVRDD